LLHKLKPVAKNSYASNHFGRTSFGRKLPPILDNKVTHYHSDGSGRDNYIGIDEGMFFILILKGGRSNNYSSKNYWEDFFKNNLRNY
jgi:hypothetical protein